MKIYSVYDEEFKPYGKILEGYDTTQLIAEMQAIALPEEGTAYKAGIDALEACSIYSALAERAFGGMPIQLGMCWGHNTRLNCLEYHRDSEINIGSHDFILLLAKMDEIEDGTLSTEKVKAFKIPAGAVVEVYATTLHFAPCHVDKAAGFRVAVVLPKGTNTPIERAQPLGFEDRLLWMRNKWLIAHAESKQAALGAYVGLVGKNIDLCEQTV